MNMKNDYFDDWIKSKNNNAVIDKNCCNKCNTVTNAGKDNVINVLGSDSFVTESNFEGVTTVTNSKNVTYVTDNKNETCNKKVDIKCLKINELSELLHLLHLLQQKKYAPAELENNANMFEPLKQFFADDWEDLKNDPAVLKAWEELLGERVLIEQGIAPPNFTATTTCVHCGIIPCPPEMTNGGQVLGCMWCFNRVKKLPIPRPKLGLINKISTR
jgi:hypothetical protein